MRRATHLLAMLACVSCHPPAAAEHEEAVAVEVRCTAVTRQLIQLTETLRGRVSAPPGGDLPVASQVAGRVVEVMVHEGDRVAADSVVAVVDGTASRDALVQADAALVQSKAAEANAIATLERTRLLVDRGIAARQEQDDATGHADQAHAAVRASVAASDMARRTLGRVKVRSPFDGVVTHLWRGAGALVDGTAGSPIVQLASTLLAEFDVDATERQLRGIETGQAARIDLASGGAGIEGAVRGRPTALDPTTGLGFVRIAMVDMKAAVTLGAFGTATVNVGKREGVLVVGSDAIRGAVADGAEVVVCKDGKAAVRTVKVGWRDDARLEIVEGLAEGERVAMDHVLGLETGAPIVEAP